MAYASAVSEIYGEILNECVACNAGKIQFWRQKNFQYTENVNQEEFHIYRCENCGTGFLNRPPHVTWLKSIYQFSGQALTQPITLAEVLAKEDEFPNCKVDAERISQQADKLNSSANRCALDIGSGFGFYTQALRKAGYGTVSINPGSYENEVFKSLNNDEPVEMMFENYEPSQQFGVVVMSQVLEHMLEPNKAINKVAKLLASGGVLVCAVPNYNSFLVKLLGTKDNACLWIPEHVNFFTENGLRLLAERNGFRVVKMEQITRIPFNCVSRRLGLTGKAAAFADRLVKFLQLPFAGLMNFFGLGIYINLYAFKD
jgi:SAM-dependent methyltransferase